MVKEKFRNCSPSLILTTLIAGLAIVSSLSVSVLSGTNSAFAVTTASQNQTANQNVKSSANATTSEATRNATTSAQNATAEAGKAATSAGNAIANATTAAGGVIGNAIANATSSINKSLNNPSSITVTPDSVNPGDLVIIKGLGFKANNTITLTFDNSSNATTAKSDKSGAFNATMTTPSDAANGSHTITATDQNGKSATAKVTIIAVAPPSYNNATSNSNSSRNTG